MYLLGDNVLITDIGEFTSPTLEGAASSLVCDTSNVNTQCCRTSDGGRVGEWFFPNGTIIPPRSYDFDFGRSGFTHQVRLNRKNDAIMPIGEYSCRVPDERESSMIHTATITIISGKRIIYKITTGGMWPSMALHKRILIISIIGSLCVYPCNAESK